MLWLKPFIPVIPDIMEVWWNRYFPMKKKKKKGTLQEPTTMEKFSKRQLTIIIVSICAVFIVMAILTMNAGDSSDTLDENMETHDLTIKKKKKESSFEFNIRNEGVDDETVDSTKVKDPLESDPFKELDELIGLVSVKNEVKSLANYVKVQKMREEKGLKTPKMSYHLVFTGSPGTGKTTVARIVARIYKDLGILKKGHLVETDRSGLIGQYVGQTAPRVNAVCDSALNGVLFIDEAYAINQGDNKNDYGDEAVATLLKRMEDDRDRLVVIVAGYTDEMKKFINSNPGLQSRFNRYINFPDYASAELIGKGGVQA